MFEMRQHSLRCFLQEFHEGIRFFQQRVTCWGQTTLIAIRIPYRAIFARAAFLISASSLAAPASPELLAPTKGRLPLTWPAVAGATGYRLTGVLRAAEGGVEQRIDQRSAVPEWSAPLPARDRPQVLQLEIRAEGVEAAPIRRRIVIPAGCHAGVPRRYRADDGQPLAAHVAGAGLELRVSHACAEGFAVPDFVMQDGGGP